MKLKIDDYVPDLGQTLGEELLTPTKIYSAGIYRISKGLPIRGLAHITGGGIEDNMLRIIPKGCNVVMHKESWDVPSVFPFLKKAGNISDKEMIRTFNNGIGMIAIVPESSAQEMLQQLNAMKEKGFIIGEIVERKESARRVEWV